MKTLRYVLRSLQHFKLHTAISLLGLAFCLTCVIIIFRYVHSEYTVDHFNSKLDRIYVTTFERSDITGRVNFLGFKTMYSSFDPPAVDIRKDPAVERYSTYSHLKNHVLQTGEKRYTANVIVADSSFLQILDYRISAGTADLSMPNNILITKSFAEKMFGKSDPLGKQMTYYATDLAGGSVSAKMVTVTGILAPVPSKSSLDFDVIVPELHFQWLLRYFSPYSLILLYPNQDYRAFNEKYSEFFVNADGSSSMRYLLFPLGKVYMSTPLVGSTFTHGKRSSVLVLGLVGFLILLAGILNFINIYTAVVLRRGREFGMKKIFGAPGWQVFFQLYLENIVMIGVAIVIALLLTKILNPVVQNMLVFDQLSSWRFDLTLAIGLLLVLPLVTTVFPFVRYNYSAPVASLQSVGKTGGRSVNRQIFLVFQNVFTIWMIVASLFFLKQLRYMLTADLGFNAAHVIKVPFASLGMEGSDRREQMANIKQRIDALPLFTGCSWGQNPVRNRYNTFNFQCGDGDLKPVTVMKCDEGLVKLLDLKLIQGRLFDDNVDHRFSFTVMVTESVLPYFGITDFRVEKLQPETALVTGQNLPYEIIGVVKDFYPSHLSVEISPIIIWPYGMGSENTIMAGFLPGRTQEAIDFMRQLHNETTFNEEFTYSFLEDDVKAMYKGDRQIATIYSLFTAIAIVISVMGLFSLSLFEIRQRRHEIAIRKVNGATTGIILGMLLKRYLKLLGISFVVAAPIGWIAIRLYLEEFAFKTAVSWWIFAVAFLVTAGVSLLTLIWQTQKAAAANPAEVINNE